MVQQPLVLQHLNLQGFRAWAKPARPLSARLFADCIIDQLVSLVCLDLWNHVVSFHGQDAKRRLRITLAMPGITWSE